MKRLVVVLALWLVAGLVVGQKGEQITVTTAEEEMDTARFSRLLATYNKIIRVHEEELTMFKVDLMGPYLYLATNWEEKDKARNNVLNISVERKIAPNWSWVLGNVLNADRVKVREVRFYGGVRYYYNMNKRILRGKSANNFSANYFGLSYYHQFRPGENDRHLTVDLLYGLQRRLGRRGFIDVDVGLENIFEAFEDRARGTDFKATFRMGWAF